MCLLSQVVKRKVIPDQKKKSYNDHSKEKERTDQKKRKREKKKFNDQKNNKKKKSGENCSLACIPRHDFDPISIPILLSPSPRPFLKIQV